MKVFQYAVIYVPKDKDKEPKLLVPVTSVLAENEDQARVEAVRESLKHGSYKSTELEFIIRPL